jgi:hypothetical protein
MGGSLDTLRSIVPPLVIEMLRRKREDPTNPIGQLAQDHLAE